MNGIMVCRRGKRLIPPACSVCHTPVSGYYLCDFIFPFGSERKSCDVPLCISCRYTPDGQQDFCPEHAKRMKGAA